jgi:hypothetical protein
MPPIMTALCGDGKQHNFPFGWNWEADSHDALFDLLHKNISVSHEKKRGKKSKPRCRVYEFPSKDSLPHLYADWY